MISPVCDSTGITSENWYQSEEKKELFSAKLKKLVNIWDKEILENR
jgi:hypothetical protein